MIIKYNGLLPFSGNSPYSVIFIKQSKARACFMARGIDGLFGFLYRQIPGTGIIKQFLYSSDHGVGILQVSFQEQG